MPDGSSPLPDVDNPPPDTIFNQDEKAYGHHHGSKKNVADLLAAATRLSGPDAAVHFGPERQKQFPAAREGELARLAEESEAQAPPSQEPVFTGGEHAVFESEGKIAVLKHTLPGFYGRIMDESTLLDPRTFLTRRKLTMRGALPSEYLRRWAVPHDIFGIPTTYEGRTGSNLAEPQMAVAQPYIEQDDNDPAEIGDVIQFMEGHGFTKVNPSPIAIPEVADVTWDR